MKKLLVVLVLFLTFGLFGCVDKELEMRIENFKEDFSNLVEDFGQPQWWSDDFQRYMGDENIEGEMDIFMYARDDFMNKLYYDGDYFLVVQMYLDPEETRGQQLVWNVMITYVDFENETYIDLDYYHYDEMWTPDWASEIFGYSFYDLVGFFKVLDIQDWQDIISDIGYEDIVEPIGGTNL